MASRIQRSLFHWSNILVSLGVLACSGKLAVLSEPVPGADGSEPGSEVGAPRSTSTSTGQDPVGSETSRSEGTGTDAMTSTLPGSSATALNSLGSCPGLEPSDFPRSYPPYMPHQQLVDCGNCTCANGEPACVARACRPFSTLGVCTSDNASGPEAEVARAVIQGDTLFLDVKGYGGCRDVDFFPCYISPDASTVASQSRYPRQATIKVFNPTGPTQCNKVAFQRLEIGLSTLKGFISEEGGLVQTTFGVAQLAALSCKDVQQLAQDQFAQSFSTLLNLSSDTFASCQTDADCVSTAHWPSCSPCTFPYDTNQTHYATLKSEIARIDAEICAPNAAACSPDVVALNGCPEPYESACRNNACERVN
ncbi:MAG: hypothetical protein ABI895_40000 [Deltaproteobacteria bacterium]